MALLTPIRAYLLKNPKTPTTTLVQEPSIDRDEALRIQQSYQALYHARRIRRTWARSITLNDIMDWSGRVYWTALEHVQDTERPYKEVAQNLVHTVGAEHLAWLTLHSEPSLAKQVFPGLMSEYIRRFQQRGARSTNYDKLVHYFWGAALQQQYGTRIAGAIGVLHETNDLFMFNHPLEVRADLQAHEEGMQYGRELHTR